MKNSEKNQVILSIVAQMREQLALLEASAAGKPTVLDMTLESFCEEHVHPRPRRTTLDVDPRHRFPEDCPVARLGDMPMWYFVLHCTYHTWRVMRDGGPKTADAIREKLAEKGIPCKL